MRASVTVETEKRLTIDDITERIAAELPANASGICFVSVNHTTAGLCVNEPEPRLLRDFERMLSELIPNSGWEHDELDGNADAHLRSALVGNSVAVPVSDGQLNLGRWGAILLVECDGPRTRSVTVQVLSGR